MNELDSIDFQSPKHRKREFAEKYQSKLIYRVYKPLITPTDCFSPSSNTSSNPKTVTHHIGKLMKRMRRNFTRFREIRNSVRHESREERSRAEEEGGGGAEGRREIVLDKQGWPT